MTISLNPPVIGGVDAGEMGPRSHNHRHGLIATLPLALLLAACGAGASPSSASHSTPTPTPSPTLVPTPSPTAVPTPAPEPPLALFYAGNGAMEVVNAQGVEQWGLTNAQEGQLFGLTAAQAGKYNFGPQSGNSNVFFSYQASPTSVIKVAVISRSGKLLGVGTAPALSSPGDASYSWAFVVSPTGTEWAWPVDQTPNSAGQHHGVVEVGGLGEANRIVYRWVAPVGFTELLSGWTNSGIIMQRTPEGGPFPCGGYESADFAWFAINPTTGTLHELFTGNDQYIDASSGVTVAGLLSDAHTVLIDGVSYSESKSIVGGAFISPDGAHVAVGRESFNPCGGGQVPQSSIAMVTVANHSHVDLQNLGIAGWWDNNDIVVSTNASLWIYTLQGKAVSEILPATNSWLFDSQILTG